MLSSITWFSIPVPEFKMQHLNVKTMVSTSANFEIGYISREKEKQQKDEQFSNLATFSQL